jgi:hypothetical protein
LARALRLGLVTDPDFPSKVGQHVAERLPDALPGQLGDGEDQRWEVEVVTDPVTAGRHSTQDILDEVDKHRAEREWDYAICLTDLPLQHDKHPVMADTDIRRRVALVSLPALGGSQPFRRSCQLITQLLDELRNPDDDHRDHRLQSKLTHLLAPVERKTPDREDVDVRYSATKVRGRIRLLTGMVRGNRPWRLLPGMSGAMAAALATAAYGLITSTIWQIGDALSAGKMVLAGMGAIAAMTGWLIFGHHLWLWPRKARDHDRAQVWLYNTSTVLTLGMGVVFLYVVLFAVYFGVGAFLVDPSVLGRMLGHPVGWTSYLTLAWGSTTMGVIAGALGSGLESDAAVRQAAYGYREEQRQTEYQRDRERERTGEDVYQSSTS